MDRRIAMRKSLGQGLHLFWRSGLIAEFPSSKLRVQPAMKSLRLAAIALSAAAAGLVALAGLWKLIDLPTFTHSLESWTLIPNWTRAIAGATVPPAELLLGSLCLIHYTHRRMYCLLASMVGAFTLIYLLHLWLADTPDCACFGKVLQFENNRIEAMIVVARNILLICAILAVPIFSFLARKNAFRALACPCTKSMQANAEDSTRGAFTLIELLVTLAIIGSLALILVPSLYQARESAKRIQRQAGLRQAVVSFHSYAIDFDDMWPQYTFLPPANTVIRANGQAFEFPYFHAYSFWHVALADYLYDGIWDSPALTPRNIHSGGLFSDYWYSASLRAFPEFWNAESRTGPAQWGPTRTTQVTYSSKKVVLRDSGPHSLLDDGRYALTPRYHAGMADGSAVSRDQSQIQDSYPHGEGSWVGSKFSIGLWGMHTIDGVRGQDIR